MAESYWYKNTCKKHFLNNLGLLFRVGGNVLNSFKSQLFSIKKLHKIQTTEPDAEPTPEVAKEPTPTKHKKSKLKLQQESMNIIIADEKDKNVGIFLNYFKYQNPSSLVKDLISAKNNNDEKLVNSINNGLIGLRNNINRKEIPENENPKKVVDIVEKIPDFNKQKRTKGLISNLAKRIKILTPKQMLQILPTALAQVNAGNTSEN